MGLGPAGFGVASRDKAPLTGTGSKDGALGSFGASTAAWVGLWSLQLPPLLCRPGQISSPGGSSLHSYLPGHLRP